MEVVFNKMDKEPGTANFDLACPTPHTALVFDRDGKIGLTTFEFLEPPTNDPKKRGFIMKLRGKRGDAFIERQYVYRIKAEGAYNPILVDPYWPVESTELDYFHVIEFRKGDDLTIFQPEVILKNCRLWFSELQSHSYNKPADHAMSLAPAAGMTESKADTPVDKKALNPLRFQIFGQHLGENRFYHECDAAPFRLLCIDIDADRSIKLFGDWSGGTNPEKSCNGWVAPWDTALLVKHLTKISDQDAIEATKLIRGQFIPESDIDEILRRKAELVEELYKRGPRSISTYPYGIIKAYQYLTEKGYGFPWEQWSVEELVELGIYKLI